MKPSAAGLVWLCAVVCTAAPRASVDPSSFSRTVQPFLAGNCTVCHNARTNTGGLSLEFRDSEAALRSPEVWENVLAKLRAGQMPPKGMPRPKPADVAAVTNWIEALLARSEAARKPDPGRLTAHRLNRFEYNNTVHDLLGVDFRPADDFPADDSGYGFDNIGDVLSLSPVLMEKYLAAATRIARLAVYDGERIKPTLDRYKSDRIEAVGPVLRARHRFPADAEYEIRTSLAGRRPLYSQHLKFAVSIDGRTVKFFETVVPEDKARIFDLRVPVKAGDREIRAEILDDGAAIDIPNPKVKDKRTIVDSIEVRGPYESDPPAIPESHRRIFVCGHANGRHTPACARLILAELARRAYRRPVTDAEVTGLTRFVDLALEQGDTFEHGIRVAVAAVLVSPDFLFRIERDPKPADASAVHPVGDFELASRLSYFLWSSMPDDELFRAAEQGALRKPGVLDAQVRRMLRDPKSARLVENFAGQWLELRNLDSVKPDPEKFPDFDESLRDAMRVETELFLGSIVREDRSILDLIDARYTYLNERLAKHYGIGGVEGPEFRRVQLSGAHRGGVLTEASVLTVTSYPNRTSPVLRGKFLLENILGAPPPPPPPDAGSLDESQVNVAGTVRQQFERHRSQPACAACHVRMDPLGFAFENYDATGRWRTREGGFPVDASGKLPGGKSFTGAAGLKRILKGEKDEFAACLAEKMLTYALGRGLERYDQAAVRQITSEMAAANYRFSSMILAIARSLPFQMGRGDGGKP